MKRRVLFKHMGNGLLLLGVIVLTYKFLAWNYWKVDMAVATANGISQAPAAVNLTLSSDAGLCFKTSFVHNSDGHYYIVNQMDPSSFINDSGKPSNTDGGPDSSIFQRLRLEVNGHNVEPDHLNLYRFELYDIIAAEIDGQWNYFVFTSKNCEIKDFVKMKNRLPEIIASLGNNKK